MVFGEFSVAAESLDGAFCPYAAPLHAAMANAAASGIPTID
jgi:hypothetical protein